MSATPLLGYGQGDKATSEFVAVPAVRSRLRCVIVEDHMMIEQLMRGMLGSLGLVEVTGVAHNVKQGVALCREHRPDLLLLDLSLPDGDGLKAARELAKLKPEARAIIVSGQAETFVCPPDLREFVYSTIDKTSAFAMLQQEVTRLREVMLPESAAETPTDLARVLSKREMEVFRLIGEGLISKEIADRLGLAKTTIDTYRKNIAAKLGTSGSELMRRAWQHSHTSKADN